MLTATISSPLPPQQQLSPDDTAYPAAAYSESSSDDNLKQNDHVENDHINHTDEEEKDEITTKALQINNNEGALHDVDNINEDQPARQSSSINEETSSTTSDKNLPSMTETQDAHKQRTRRANVATIQDDASTAFSPYQPTPSLEAMNSNVPMRYPKKKKKKSKKRRGKLNQNENNNNTKQAKSGQKATAVADINEVDTIETSSTKPQHLSDTLTSISNDDRDGMLQNVNDPILQHYLPKLTFLNDNFYTKVKPYGIGRRNLPQNQIELILRRRAVKKKKDDNHKGDAAAAAAATGHKRPPLSTTPTTRRKVFPSTQQHFDDDSTISSATAASTWTAGSKTQHSRDTTSSPPNTTTNHDSSEYPTQQYSSSEPSLIAPLPQEEIVGDTSLGLKLTILQGKVIIQAIDSLNDGRASPAQLCGLISPGDILIAVNGKSLINGTIHNPAPMDRIISVLQPLSQPMDETSGEYSREVRLRLVLGEGMDLLREQKQREDKKREDMERRKALGFDRQNSGGGDAAGDIFGIASFMAVDQHSGMPLFGHLDHPQHHVSKAASTPKRQTTAVTDNRVDSIERNEQKVIRSLPTPQTLQEQIARQVALDRQWIRNRNTSEFFSLNNDASVMLRPPT
eukprot:CAMPEP_0113404516 /NCGR_PEP_ID=MMETSP0013_2-20120614/18435_1 /TAXON_ID=2843 ORGANISM="Skeletonema costatum, Strain 1716" /NCGR_SAMPLE_ID=MMETSP0013_2 /ASSEMBLY_ACC=CAM_ASM_000158 /LENGTH=626 /DNA_ID=CAMNT_0000290131 /DNA_START=155 /DNA_END=2031 /DNA_ORIENTATION=+ /assembly_acc=CAM_ASM_000158